MKNHINKLHRDLDEWKSIMPDCHTPKLAARRIGKIQSELEEWRTAVPNCETPQKLVKRSTKEKTHLTKQFLKEQFQLSICLLIRLKAHILLPVLVLLVTLASATLYVPKLQATDIMYG